MCLCYAVRDFHSKKLFDQFKNFGGILREFGFQKGVQSLEFLLFFQLFMFQILDAR